MSLKTSENNTPIHSIINIIKDSQTQEDCKTLDKLLSKISGNKGKMWGDSIIGYGKYSYTRSDGKNYEFFAIGFSPRVGKISIYCLPGYDKFESELKKLGSYKIGKSCLYIKKLSDIDLSVLEKILSDGYQAIANKHLDYKSGKLA